MDECVSVSMYVSVCGRVCVYVCECEYGRGRERHEVGTRAESTSDVT